MVLSRQMHHHLDCTTVVCEACSFVYTNPMPAEDVYRRFHVEAYARFYGKTATGPPKDKGQREPDFAKAIFERIEEVKPLDGSRVLEIGSGNGEFLWWAKKRRLSVVGIEPNVQFYRSLCDAGLPVQYGTLEDLTAIPKESIDVIVMREVLEHFYEPNWALQRVWELLAPDGILVLTVPNILKPWRSLDRYFLRYVHPNTFSPTTLPAMLGKHRFDVCLLDTGSDDWRVPQSIFCIARKGQAARAFTPESNAATAKDILEACSRYRRKWTLVWATRYRLFQIYAIVYRLLRPILRLVKRF
ncbi:MAG: class I SAM-dependent methyltransferase [Bacteroidota bacterium]